MQQILNTEDQQVGGGISMAIENALVERISNIIWFSNCGNKLELNINFEVVNEANWKKATKQSQSRYWEEITQEAGNKLTEFLSVKFPDRYKERNKLVRESKELIEVYVVPEINEYINHKVLSPLILENVKWDVVSAIMEYNYKAEKEPIFFLELLKVYESGNFPCGWKGSWPDGKLIVY
ncbi:hypothetical protein [Paenibacillus sp. NPDC058174]|uniref:hypothetical protein n=1 Tax=Paenibacillus sp. NPDC058174 TaxID=3346366 RepID=UPI0036DBACB8